MRSILAMAMTIALQACAGRGKSEVEYFAPIELQGTTLPFSEAVRVDDVLYLSGQIGNVPGQMRLVEGKIAEQTAQALRNIQSVLERHGSGLDRVVKCTVFLTDMRDWPAMNTVYRSFFSRNLPARSALASPGLALGALVEIECIAVVDR